MIADNDQIESRTAGNETGLHAKCSCSTAMLINTALYLNNWNSPHVSLSLCPHNNHHEYQLTVWNVIKPTADLYMPLMDRTAKSDRRRGDRERGMTRRKGPLVEVNLGRLQRGQRSTRRAKQRPLYVGLYRMKMWCYGSHLWRVLKIHNSVWNWNRKELCACCITASLHRRHTHTQQCIDFHSNYAQI